MYNRPSKSSHSSRVQPLLFVVCLITIYFMYLQHTLLDRNLQNTRVFKRRQQVVHVDDESNMNSDLQVQNCRIITIESKRVMLSHSLYCSNIGIPSSAFNTSFYEEFMPPLSNDLDKQNFNIHSMNIAFNHRMAWQSAITQNKTTFVMEDDVILPKQEWKSIIRNLPQIHCSVLKLHNARPLDDILFMFDKELETCKPWMGRSAAAYIIDPCAARVLMQYSNVSAHIDRQIYDIACSQGHLQVISYSYNLVRLNNRPSKHKRHTVFYWLTHYVNALLILLNLDWYVYA